MKYTHETSLRTSADDVTDDAPKARRATFPEVDKSSPLQSQFSVMARILSSHITHSSTRSRRLSVVLGSGTGRILGVAGRTGDGDLWAGFSD